MSDETEELRLDLIYWRRKAGPPIGLGTASGCSKAR